MNDENKATVSPSRPLICSTARHQEIAERTNENHTHDWETLFDEYGGVSHGDYQRLQCKKCGKQVWSELPN